MLKIVTPVQVLPLFDAHHVFTNVFFEQFPSLDLVSFESNGCFPITFKQFLNVERFELFQHFTRSVIFSKMQCCKEKTDLAVNQVP